MIKRISFTNFKCLRNLTLDFVDGVNIISGSSDTGKTTVLRGLQWALFNTPQGRGAITHGEKEGRVEVELDKSAITRGIKGNNFYQLDGESFSAFRTSVPKPIEDLVNMADINVQNRRDMPFMISEKAGDVAQRFSAMLDLDEISVSLGNIDTEAKSVERACGDLEEELKRVTGEEEALSWIDAAESEWEKIESLQQRLTELSKTKSELEGLFNQFAQEMKEYRRLRPIIEADKELRELVELSNQLAGTHIKAKQYSKLLQDYNASEKRVADLISAEDAFREIEELEDEQRRLVDSVSRQKELVSLFNEFTMKQNIVTQLAPAEAAGKDLEGILEQSNVMEQTKAKRQELSVCGRSFAAAFTTYQDRKQDWEKAKQVFEEAMPDICPLCGNLKGKCDD